MKRNSIIGIAGMRGHGKSTILREKVSGLPRVLIIDTLADHGEWAPRLPGGEREQIDAITAGKFTCNSVLVPVEEDAQQFLFQAYAKACYASAVQQKQEVTLVVEEVDWYSNPNWENEGLKLIVQYGRHGPVNLVWTARNLGSVSRKLTSETDLYILFSVQEPAWLDALSERLGADVSSEVSGLEQFHYIIVDNRGVVQYRGITQGGETSAEKTEETDETRSGRDDETDGTPEEESN
jgi:hypothetical protein